VLGGDKLTGALISLLTADKADEFSVRFSVSAKNNQQKYPIPAVLKQSLFRKNWLIQPKIGAGSFSMSWKIG
jgi:hypothetical protein